MEWLHPSAVLLACSPDPFPGHSLWVTSPTHMSVFSLCLHWQYTAVLKSVLFASGLINFRVQTALLVFSFQCWCPNLLSGQNKTVRKAYPSLLDPWENSFFLHLRLEQKHVYFNSKCRYWGEAVEELAQNQFSPVVGRAQGLTGRRHLSGVSSSGPQPSAAQGRADWMKGNKASEKSARL